MRRPGVQLLLGGRPAVQLKAPGPILAMDRYSFPMSDFQDDQPIVPGPSPMDAPTPRPAGPPSRRELKTRSRPWAHMLAGSLARRQVSPNMVSLSSVLFSALAGILVGFSGHTGSAGLAAVLLLVGAGCIQLRLLANMLDGLIAVENHLHTATGDLFNEVPDRVDDLFILIGVGCGCGNTTGLILGLLAAVGAVFTAYVRLLGGSLGMPQYFVGPMAKQHRMALVTVACVIAGLEQLSSGTSVQVLSLALLILIAGVLITAGRRLSLITHDLRSS